MQRHLFLAAVGAALALSACVDRDNPAGPQAPAPGGTGLPPAEPILLQAIDCRVEVASRAVRCRNAEPADGMPDYLIVGNQNTYVTLTSTDPDYDAGTGAFTMNVTVRNLIPQPLGTADTMPAMAPDANGVRVFFSSPPVATAGTGAIDVVEDGQDFFTAANQDYYQYNTVLEQFELSAPKAWRFNVPATVESFHFGVYVAAAVPWPNGYVRVTGNFNVLSGNERQLTARAYNAVGEEDPVAPAFTWMALDSTRAAVNGTGMVHGQRAGATGIVAMESGGLSRTGTVMMSVMPIRRVWTGAAGVTSWENGANWLPDSIPPQPADTAVVPDTATIFPLLNQNESVGGVEVLDLTPGGTVPAISLGAFNLDASGSVVTTNSGFIDNTAGRLILSGIAQTVEGRLPPVTVTGTYSLSGNVLSRASLRVQSGRLRSTSFRIRTESY
ncbi:MAG TPA: hypothetical protein VFZ20_17775 [Longimicrobium sp.]|nr:hypothetical protein [Longimicrobium sp.]